ncbi:MAG TPA: response regulator [Thermoanaerobaculia bacterium]|nr:response regulator [Thermoanaerobaculia bacterium]
MAVLPKVLVVEDDDSIRALLTAALRREGLDVDAARDGLHALRFCETCEYAVIVLDLMMPVLNGFEFLDALTRATPAARSVIFVVTAFDDRLVKEVSSPRVHAIVRKPFDVHQLATTVREVAWAWNAAVQPSHPDAPPLLEPRESIEPPC